MPGKMIALSVERIYMMMTDVKEIFPILTYLFMQLILNRHGKVLRKKPYKKPGHKILS